MPVKAPDKTAAKNTNVRNREDALHSPAEDAYDQYGQESFYHINNKKQDEISSIKTSKNRTALKLSYQFGSTPLHPKLPGIIQNKLAVNIPGDVYEQEADAVAEKIIQSPAKITVPVAVSAVNTNPTITKAGEEKDKFIEEEEDLAEPEQAIVQRKPVAMDNGEDEPHKKSGSHTPGVTPAVLQTIQSAGRPLDNSVRAFMEPRFRYDFSKVRIHDDPQAQRSAKDINALAYTYGSNIIFGSSQYQPQTQNGKKLLAHELTHVVQQNSISGKRLQRQTNPDAVKGFQLLPESIYVVAKADFFLLDAPDSGATLKSRVTIKNERLELTWKSGDWYYAVAESGNEGYVKAVDLVFPPAVDPKKAAVEEYVAVLNNTLFIQAKNMHRAFVLAKAAKLTPNAGMIFWYSNGRMKPYPVDYVITIREPSADEIAKMQKLAGFESMPAKTGSATPATGTAAVPGLTLTPEQAKWQAAEKELEPYVQEFLLQPSQTVPGEMVMNVPNESLRALNFKFEEFRLKKGFPFSQDADSDFAYYYTVFELLIRAKIKETMTRSFYKPTNPLQDTGGLEWLVDAQQKMVVENEGLLKGELEKIIKEEQEKRKADIAAFFKPYKDSLQKEQDVFAEKAKQKIEKMEGWYNREVEKKAAEEVMKKRREEVLATAQAEFAKSKLAKEIQDAVEKRYAEVEKTVTHPDPYKDPVIAADAILVDQIKAFDTKFSTAAGYAEKKKIFLLAKEQLGTYLLTKYPVTAQSLLQKILVYYSNTLLITAKGEISVYGIKKWAERNRDDVDAVIQKFSPVFHRRFQKDASQMHLMDMQSMTGAAYTDLSFELLYAKKFFQKVIDHPENDEGFWAGFTSKSLSEFIPFLHSILSISKLYEQMRVANKKLMGGTLTVSEELLLKAVAALHQINEMKKKPFWYRVGEGVADAIPFIGEFIITAPIGLGAGSVAEKVTESAIKKIAEKYIEKRLVKLIIKGTGVLIGSLFQTLANPLDIEKNILEHKMHTVGIEVNPDGSITVHVAANKDSEATAVWKGFITSYINVFTERMGGKLLPFLGSKVAGRFARFLPMSVRSNVFTNYLKITSKALEKYTGFHGILGEYEEEVYGQVLESLLKGEQLKWSWEDQAQTFMVVAIMGAPVKGIQNVFVAYEIMRTLKFKGKNTVLPANVYTALTRLTSESALAEFDALLDKEKLTPVQKEMARYLAQKTLNIEHEIKLSQEELTEVRAGQQATLPQTINELTSLIIVLYKARKNLLIGKQSGKPPALQSVLLQGEEGASIPLILYNIEQADKWILETENAIAGLEGLTMKEIRSAAKAGVGIEASVQLWTRFAAGWRPYIEQVKELSPASIISLNADGLININGNILISRAALVRMLLMARTDLNRLLSASLDVKKETDSGNQPPAMSDEDQQKVKLLHRPSTVNASATGTITFNDQIQVSNTVLQKLKKVDPAPAVTDTKKKEPKKKPETFSEFDFLFDNSYELNARPADFANITEADKAKMEALHPGSVFEDAGTGFILINNQIQVSNSFLKELLLKDPSQLQQLLSVTFNLEKVGGDIKKLSDGDLAIMENLNKSAGLRLRFKYHYETELQTFINNTGLITDPRFKNIWDNAGLNEKIRFWDLYNEIGGFVFKDKKRPTDKTPDLRKQASDFALRMNPANLFELVDFYQYYQAKFKLQVKSNVEAYTNQLNIAKQQAGKGSNSSQIEKALSKQVFGESFEGTGPSFQAAAVNQTLKDLSDPTQGTGKISALTFKKLNEEYDAGKQALQGNLGSTQIKPGMTETEAVKAIKAIPNLSFTSETAAVYHVEKHYLELPESLRTTNQPAKEYMDAARKTVQEAQQVSSNFAPAEADVRNFGFSFSYQDPANNKRYELKTFVKEKLDGSVSITTLMIFEKKEVY